MKFEELREAKSPWELQGPSGMLFSINIFFSNARYNSQFIGNINDWKIEHNIKSKTIFHLPQGETIKFTGTKAELETFIDKFWPNSNIKKNITST